MKIIENVYAPVGKCMRQNYRQKHRWRQSDHIPPQGPYMNDMQYASAIWRLMNKHMDMHGKEVKKWLTLS